jgi:hypothetical protein
VIQPRHRLALSVAALLALCVSPYASADDLSGRVRHPNLLLNRDEIEQVRAEIRNEEWAARLFDRVKQLADQQGRTDRIPREAALVYVLTGEPRYGQAVRKALVSQVRQMAPRFESLDLQHDPDFGAWGAWATFAWAYDLTYDVFTAEEREAVERLLRTAARTIIEGLKLRPTTPNLVFEKHWKVALIGYCLGDNELIDWGLNDPGQHGPQRGGFYPVLDTMIKDGLFWGEAPIYALHYDLHGMLAMAEAALHYDGTDLYHYVSARSGASIKGLIDGYLRLAYPPERTGIGRGSVRMATFGDGSTSYSPSGELHDTFLVNPINDALGEVVLSGELEVAFKRYGDPGYAWLISLNDRRDAYIGSAGQGNARPVWGFAALTHGVPLPERLSPPAAPGGVYASQGFAMIRSDESPRYWETGALAAIVRLGSLVGHGHKDYFHLMLHGKGRLLYPDVNLIQYEPTYLNWTHEGVAHNTLLVDRQSPRPGPFTTRHDFTPEAKFFQITGSAFEGTTQTRALMMTPDYLVDVFRASDNAERERTFDWVLHGLGRLAPGNPAAYRPTEVLIPHYWWIDREQRRTTGQAWQVDWIQKSAGVTRGIQRLGPEWFDSTVGVRLRMLGAPDTEVYLGEGPIADGPPYHRIDGNPEGSSPVVIARRKGPAATFVAVHEPYETQTALRRVSRIDETKDAVGLAVDGDTYSDRILVAYDPDQEFTLRGAEGESFTFRGHGLVRIAGERLTARGGVQAFRVHAPRSGAGAAVLMVNGEPKPVRIEDGFAVFGNPARDPGARSTALAPAHDDPESTVSTHYAFLPEEVHLPAGREAEAETTIHLRAVGAGTTVGSLRFKCPAGITVEPAVIDLTGMKEGQERTVRLHVKAAAGVASALHEVRLEAVGGLHAASGSLPVSVGVVMTEDTRLPMLAQWVIRAPGYTMKVDTTSGVSYYLLDADGNRRHGRLHNTNFCYGIPAVECEGEWVIRYGKPSRFVWDGPNSLTTGASKDRYDGRLKYTFHEDRIAIGLIEPTDARQEFTLWLGNFDALKPPLHNGAEDRRSQSTEASFFFFPHPVHRQGVVLSLPKALPLRHTASSVRFPIRAGQTVELRFATQGEAAKLLNPGQSSAAGGED